MDTWQEIPEFPGYSVSVEGEVRNDDTGKLLANRVNVRGVYVGLCKDRVQHSRMVSRLVASAFLDLPPLPYHRQTFDTPINLNGDRTDNHVKNLMWRPRWFAVKFHQQFGTDWSKGPKVKEVATGAEFVNVLEAAKSFGLLAFEIFVEAMNHGVYGWQDIGVWPTGYHFEAIDNKSRRNRRL